MVKKRGRGMSETKKSRKTNLIIGIAGGGIVLFVLGIIILMTVMPMIKGSSELSARVEAIRDAEIRTVEIADPRNSKAHAVVTDPSETAKIRDLICRITELCSYDGDVYSQLGHWDLRIRFFVSDKKTDFYLTESYIYVTVGDTQYRFKPTETGIGEYAEIYGEIKRTVE
jgi:hypothetical protein